MSKRVRQIRITPVLNGFVVSVGCQEVVFESRGKLLEELHNYLNDPGEVEKAYIRQAVNPVSDSPLAVEETVPPGTPATLPQSTIDALRGAEQRVMAMQGTTAPLTQPTIGQIQGRWGEDRQAIGPPPSVYHP